MKCSNMLSTYFWKVLYQYIFKRDEISNDFLKHDRMWYTQSCVRHHDLCVIFLQCDQRQTCVICFDLKFSNKIILNPRCVTTFITCTR
jgi:hypothetical protein